MTQGLCAPKDIPEGQRLSLISLSALLGFPLRLLSPLFSSIHSLAPGGSCVCTLLFPYTCRPLLVFKQYQEMPPNPQPLETLNSSENSNFYLHYFFFVEEPRLVWQRVIIIDGGLITQGTALQHVAVNDEVMA